MANAGNARRERLKRQQEEDSNRGSGNNFSVLDTKDYPDLPFLKLEPDTEYVLDILPYEVTSKNHPKYDKLKADDFLEDYKLEVEIHRGIGPSKKSIVCPKNYGRSCEICDEHDSLLEQKKAELGDDKKAWNDKDVRALRATRRCFMIVEDKTDGGKQKIWDYSAAWAFDNLLKRAKRKGKLLGDLIFEEESIVFTPEASQFDDKKPGEIKTFDFESEGKYDFKEEDIATTPKLDQMLIVYTADEIHNFLWGNTSDDDDSSEDEVTTRSRRAEKTEEEAPSRRRRSAPEEEEEKEDTSSREGRRRRRSAPEEPQCPSGQKFGQDIDSIDACADCAVYDACDAKYTELNPED